MAMQTHDPDRIQFNRQLIKAHRIDALVCSLPSNVLLLSGYNPVVGSGIAIATPDSTTLIVPDDEQDLAQTGWADDIRPFEYGSLNKIQSLPEAIQPTLGEALKSLKLQNAIVAYEHGPWVQPASYAAMNLFGSELPALLKSCLPSAKLTNGDELLQLLRLVKTKAEIGHIRDACNIAAAALIDGFTHIRAGQTETQVATHVQQHLLQSTGDDRVAGFAFCMTGPHAAQACKAYQRCSQRKLQTGDLALVHCNSTAGGFWTDITRTYCLGQPTQKQRDMYEAVFAARDAAMSIIAPGAKAADIDHAARSVLESRGFGPQFKHPTGHGVGFGAINHNGRPRIHPLSDETLQPGMVFNVEPAIYFDGESGLRQCDMVAVTDDGSELLTPFQGSLEELII